MAITYNTGTSTQGSAASFTFSHTVAGSDPVLLVSVSSKSAAFPLATGVTWNTTENLTRITGAAFGSVEVGELWYLMNPTTTTANVVVNNNTSSKTVCAAVSYAGVDSVITSNAVVSGNQSTSGTSTITTLNTNSVVVNALAVRGLDSITNNNASYTLRVSNNTTGSPANGNTNGRIYDQGVGTNLAIGSYTTSYTIGAVQGWIDIQAELKEKVTLTSFNRGYVIKPFK